MSWVTVGTTAATVIGGAVSGKAQSDANARAQRQSTNRWLAPAAQDAIKRGQTIADRPYSAYTGNRFTGLSANEQRAGEMAGSLAGRYQPQIDRAGAAFSREGLAQFENPYMEDVVQGRIGDVNRSYDTQLGGLNRKRGMMDAFGTDRGTLMEAGLQRNRAREIDRVSAEGRSSAYQSALDSYFKDKQSALETARMGTLVGGEDISNLERTGKSERALLQAQNDFDYGQYLEGRDWDVTNMKPLLDAIRAGQGTPGAPDKQTTDWGSMITGLGTAAIGAYAAYKNPPGGIQPSPTPTPTTPRPMVGPR